MRSCGWCCGWSFASGWWVAGVVVGFAVVVGGILGVVACVISGYFFVGLVTFCVKPRLFLSLHLISSS